MTAARDRGIEEIQVEVRVVAHQDRALAAVLAHRRAHRREHVVQRLVLAFGETEGMVEVDAGDLQRLRIDVGTGGRHHVRAGAFAEHVAAGRVQVDRAHRDLQQRVPVPVEAAGLDIDHHRQEAAEARRHGGEGRGRGRFGQGAHRR